MAGTSVPPWTPAIASGLPGPIFFEPAVHQFPLAGLRVFELPPQDGAKLSPEPAIQVFEDTLCFRQPEIIDPAAQNGGCFLDNPGERTPAPPREHRSEVRLEPRHRACRHSKAWFVVSGHGVTQKRSVPRSITGTFSAVNLELQPPFKKSGNRRRHSLCRPP